MHKFLIILFILFFYSCGDDSSTNSPSIDYHTDDQQFIDDLVLLNNSIENENVIDRITTTDFIDDSTGSQYYKIKQLNLNNMSLDSIPNSIINLDSLKILNLSNNQIEFGKLRVFGVSIFRHDPPENASDDHSVGVKIAVKNISDQYIQKVLIKVQLIDRTGSNLIDSEDYRPIPPNGSMYFEPSVYAKSGKLKGAKLEVSISSFHQIEHYIQTQIGNKVALEDDISAICIEVNSLM